LTSLVTITLGALVSVLVAWVTSRRTIVVEREKTRLSSEQGNLAFLVQARLMEYPALYSLLSDMAKAFDPYPTVSLDLECLLKQFNQWDSKHSILMSLETSNCCHKFRKALVKAVHGKLTPSKENLAHLLERATELELALRGDLGIHGLARNEEGHLVAEPGTY
jgi:hypothetical protein